MFCMKNNTLLLKNAAFGLAEQKLVFDHEGEPADIVLLDGNPALEKILGVNGSAIAGVEMSEIIPGVFDGRNEILTKAAQLEVGGPVLDYVFYSAHTGKHYQVQMNAIAPNQFVACYVDISRLKAHQINPIQHEASFRKMLDTTTTSVFIYSGERFVYVNPACSKLTGYTREELLHELNFWDVAHPDDREFVKFRAFARLSGEDVPAGYEFRLITRQGEVKWIEYNASVTDWQGEKAVIGSAFDITSRKESEEILAKSEERFRMVMQHMPNLANAFDEDGNIVFWNKACERVTGYTAEEVVGNPEAMRWMYPDDHYRKEVWEAAQDPDNTDTEATLITKSGKKRIITWDDTYHKIKIPGWSSWGIGEDVTERREAEAIRRIQFNIANAVAEMPDMASLIRMIRAELSPLIDTSNFYIALYDQERAIFHTPYAHDQEDSIPEWDAESSITGLVVRLGRSLLLSRQEIQHLIDKGVVKQIGSMCEVWMGVPLSTGKDITGVVSVQSYDDPHAFDEKSLALLEFISTQIGLTVQLRQYIEDLKIAKQKAEESDKLKTAFLNNISHEIRTPLNSILGFGRLLTEEDVSRANRIAHIRNVQVSSKRLIETVEGMIDLSMIVSGTVQIRKKNLDIARLFDDLRGRHRYMSEKKGLQLIFHYPDGRDQRNIDTDSILLHKVLSHLIDNAIKFTIKGSVETGVSASSGRLLFFVRDTGVGMDPDFIDQAFEPFSQENIATTRGHEGSGMGLAIAKGLIIKLGGDILVESAKGKGSTFYVSHPL